MSDEEQTATGTQGTTAVDDGTDAPQNKDAYSAGNEESIPEFQQLDAKKTAVAGKFELQRFAGVQVVLTAELGKTHISLQELMGLNEGAVIELDRAISSPVELVAQGVPLGNGEVVVIEDRFAIRIKQIYQG